MKTTDSLPSAKDIVAIIKACGEAGVLHIDLGALKIRFQEMFQGAPEPRDEVGPMEPLTSYAVPEDDTHIDPLEDPVAWQRAGMSFSTTAEGVADEAQD